MAVEVKTLYRAGSIEATFKVTDDRGAGHYLTVEVSTDGKYTLGEDHPGTKATKPKFESSLLADYKRTP